MDTNFSEESWKEVMEQNLLNDFEEDLTDEQVEQVVKLYFMINDGNLKSQAASLFNKLNELGEFDVKNALLFLIERTKQKIYKGV